MLSGRKRGLALILVRSLHRGTARLVPIVDLAPWHAGTATEQDSVATSATRPGVSPPAGQTGGGVKPHPGPAPGVGLLLAGVFVEKMLRKKREVPPQAGA